MFLVSINQTLYHLPYVYVPDTPCSGQPESPCLGLLLPHWVPLSSPVPRARSSNTNPSTSRVHTPAASFMELSHLELPPALMKDQVPDNWGQPSNPRAYRNDSFQPIPNLLPSPPSPVPSSKSHDKSYFPPPTSTPTKPGASPVVLGGSAWALLSGTDSNKYMYIPHIFYQCTIFHYTLPLHQSKYRP